jgi:hypothetical protein
MAPVALDTRTDILNFLARRNGYRRYLEIGVRTPAKNFDQIRARVKHGVDPDPRGDVTHRMTSDDFFLQLAADSKPYDLVLVDGLHLERQVLRDVLNSLDHLALGGAIVLHDCNPPREAFQTEEYDGHSQWHGTVWKAFARLRMTRPDLAMCVVDTDWGVGVVTRGSQDLFPAIPDEDLTYAFLDSHRKELLNLVTKEEFPSTAQRFFGPGLPSQRWGRLVARR